MCDWCGAPAALLDGFSVVERPAHWLFGRLWEGTHSQAADGAIRPLLDEAKTVALSLSGLWVGPIAGISWNERADGFRYLVGVEGAPETRGLQRVDLPHMRFATAWHDAGDGDVVDHYQHMLDWMEREGLRWDKTHMHHREEYPVHADFAAPPVLRLMVPVL